MLEEKTVYLTDGALKQLKAKLQKISERRESTKVLALIFILDYEREKENHTK